MAKETKKGIEKVAKERLKQGWIHAIVLFEIVGKPREHVDSSAKQLLDTLEKDERVLFLERNFGKAKTTDDGYFSAFAEVDILIKDSESLVWLAINFTPSTVEIIEPLSFTFSARDLQTWYNDLLAHLHHVGYNYKSQTSELQFLRTNLASLINNTLLLSLARSPKTLEQVCKDTSLTKDTAEPHLKRLVEQKKVTEKAGRYALV
jgi:hypothetical protein